MAGNQIAHIRAREILDSRGNPTILAQVMLESGIVGIASVPSGASTGSYEAFELRDGGARYVGMGVQTAIKNIEKKIAPILKGCVVSSQREIDERLIALDGTPQKKRLGANAILAVSLAAARAGAQSSSKPLYQYIRSTFDLKYKDWRMPVPTMNVFNGGRHANNGLSIQEFMIVPQHRFFKERVRIGAEVFHTLKKILIQKKLTTGVGDEGGFAPHLPKNEDAIKLIIEAIRKAGYTPGKQVMLALDMAASEFFSKKQYQFAPGQKLSSQGIIDVLALWVKKYPLVSIEDPLAEDDWQGWQNITKKLGKKVLLVGDDLFVTNTKRIEQGITGGAANAVLIKVNQIGTLSEAIDAVLLAQNHGYQISVSHRSGETADSFIADLAVAVHAEYIKSGSLSRSERLEKYNRLMEIEEEL